MLNAYLSFGNKDAVLRMFASVLKDQGWNLYGSKGTADFLSDLGAVALGDPILNHRVVSLTREVHAGLLAREPQDAAEMESLGLKFLHMAVVGLYDTEPLIKDKGGNIQAYAEINEKTDIGGPTIIRSAIKGGRIVLCNPEAPELQELLDWLKADRPQNQETLAEQWANAEQKVADYVGMIARYRKRYLKKLGNAL